VKLAEPAEVIFVGGVAHSGASVVVRLLDAHPRLVALPVAARFHSDEKGLPALLAGQIGLDDFAGELRGRWWGGRAGLGQVVDRARLEAAIEAFRESYHRDPLAASRELFFSLLGPVSGGERSLVESSPGNLRQAQALARVFPQARFVHVVRDGRDVAAAPASDLRLSAGIRSWAGRLREIEAALGGEEDGAPYAIPVERLSLVCLDQLVAADREAAYEALLGALALADAPEARSFMERALGPEEVGRGRWRERARGPGGAWALERRYSRTLAELERERNHAAPALREAYERLG
jgi:Sulfotransferase family